MKSHGIKCDLSGYYLKWKDSGGKFKKLLVRWVVEWRPADSCQISDHKSTDIARRRLLQPSEIPNSAAHIPTRSTMIPTSVPVLYRCRVYEYICILWPNIHIIPTCPRAWSVPQRMGAASESNSNGAGKSKMGMNDDLSCDCGHPWEKILHIVQ